MDIWISEWTCGVQSNELIQLLLDVTMCEMDWCKSYSVVAPLFS